MRKAILVLGVAIAGFVLGTVISPLRYRFVASPTLFVIYRCDRITGRVDVALGPGKTPWVTVPARVQDLDDDQLKALPKSAGNPPN